MENRATGIYIKALITFKRRVLTIQRSGYTNIGIGEWDIPGGRLQFGEDLLACLHREVKEETGLAVRVDRLLYAISTMANPSLQGIGLIYLCRADTDEVILSHEHTEFLWATKQQLKERITHKTLMDYTSNSVFEILDIDQYRRRTNEH